MIKILKRLITESINLCRSAWHIISASGAAPFGFMLLLGTYFGYTVIKQMITGTTFFEAKNRGIFLFCFDWTGNGTADRAGIVVGNDGEFVYAVEGNNGDVCRVRCYSLNSSMILGYGLPNY